MTLSLWWVVLILVALKVLVIIQKVLEEEYKKLGVVLELILIVLSIGFTSPITFNSVFNYLGLEIVLNWYEVLPLSLTLHLLTYNISNAIDIIRIKKIIKHQLNNEASE